MEDEVEVTVNVEPAEPVDTEQDSPTVVVIEDSSDDSGNAEPAVESALVSEAIDNAGEVAELRMAVDSLVAIVTAQAERIDALTESQTVSVDMAAAALAEAEAANAPDSDPALDDEPSREHPWYRAWRR